ncbi:MAG: DOMON-like domain-containing protein [Gammaproteobacteria bacterium]
MSADFTHNLSLVPFIAEESGAVRAFEVNVGLSKEGALSLHYVLEANLSRLRLAPAREPDRTDELWKHTCFEAFVRSPGGAPYREFNFSPSTQWAAYSFEGYRQGMAAANVSTPPHVLVEQSANRLDVTVQLELGTASRSVELALAAVLEDENGRLTYWALKHPAAKPDFHHQDAFTLKLRS